MKNQMWIRKAVRLVGMLAVVTSAPVGFLGTPVQAQTTTQAATLPPAKTTSLRFSKIVVRGNQRIESATIRNFSGIQTGKAVTPGQINAAFQSLKATGLFEQVEVTPRGNSLVIEVREFPTISRINFERNKKLKDAKLAQIINSRTRHTYSPTQAEADVALIIEAYRQAGRQNAEVRPKIIRRSDNRVDLVFEIFEGKVVEIERLSFVGNRTFSDRRLRRVLSTKQAGVLRGLIKSDTFIADRVEFDKQVLRDFYQSRGFVDFEVLSVAAEVSRERNGFFLTFKVREGQSYTFGELSTSSDLVEIDPDDFQKIIRLKEGDTYSPSRLEATLSRMETLATKKGLNFIRVTPRVTRSDKDRTLGIEFVIEKGPRVFVERIDVEGNTTTLDKVIRRQFDTVEGDPFDPRKIREASDRIKALGFFASSDVSAREGSSPDRVVVDVDVVEKNTGSLSFGLSYGAGSGVGGTISLSESNFLGRGQFLKFEVGIGSSNIDGELTFAEPHFLDRNVRFELSVYRRSSTQQNANYNTLNTGFSPNISFPVSENGKMVLSYLKSTAILSGKSPASSFLIQNGTRSKGSLGLVYNYNSVGRGLNPRAGMVFRLTSELAGFGGTARFVRSTAMIGARTTILNDAVVLSLEVEGGLLRDSSGTSTITDRFFMGSSIMRGFALNGIGPRDTAVTNQDALGGNMYAVARMEANFPLGLPEEYGLSGGLFMDVGSLWGLDDLRGGLTGTLPVETIITAGMDIRAVVGFSVFWKTAIGPLRFNFSRVVKGQTYDVPESISISIGKSF